MNGTNIQRRSLLAGALSAVVGVATGCTAGPGAAGGGGSAITIYDGRTGQFTANFNPFLISTANTATFGMIYEPLMFFNQARSGDVQPLLATEYRWVDGGRTLQVTLRDGVRWSDGKPLTAEDVAYTFDLIKSKPQLNTGGLPLASTSVADATHVSISFTRPAYGELWNIVGLTYIVPKHLWSAIGDPETNTNSTPVGSGAYVFKSLNAQSYELAKNPDYWAKGKPGIDAIRFISLSGNQAALTALAGGQIDWAGIFIPDIENAYVAKSPNNKYLKVPMFLTGLTANCEQGPTSDPAVRQAIYHALDRDQLNKLAASGYSTDATPAQLLLPRDEQWLADDLKGVKPPYDPARAERLLVEAGYTKDASAVYTGPRGKLSINAKVVAGYTDQITGLQVMRQQLAKVGIDLQPEEVSYSAFVAARNNGQFQLVIDNLYGGPEPYQLYHDFYHSSRTAPIGQPAEKNYARYRNALVDQALDRVAGTEDKKAHRAAYVQVQHEIARDLPYIPVYQANPLVEYNGGKISGLPTADNPYALPMPFQKPDLGFVAANLKIVR